MQVRALIGLTLAVVGFLAARRSKAHKVAEKAADAGLIPDLRLYAYGGAVRPAFRETLSGADLRPSGV